MRIFFAFIKNYIVAIDLIQHDPLRKPAYSIYRDFQVVKIENFHKKFFVIFLIFAQNIDCGYTLELPRRGGFNEYLQSMF